MTPEDEIYSKRIDAILNKKDRLIITSEAEFVKGFSNIEKAIFDAVRNRSFELTIKDGKVVFDDPALDVVNTLNKTIRDAIQSSDYPDKVSSYLRDFDKVKEYNLDAISKVNDLSPKELENLINPIQKAVVKQTLDGLAGTGIDTNFSDPLKTGLFKNIVAGSTFADLENYLRDFILTDEVKLGGFRKYVTQISRDALNQYDGQINSKIAEEYGLNAYRYVGSLIEDSRPQCRRWTTIGVLLLEELASEIAWANSSGSGMIPGTTPENFAIYRGGYNCRHSAVPFKMTKSQLANLAEEREDPNKVAKEEKKLKKEKVEPLPTANKDLVLTYGNSKKIPANIADEVRRLGIPDQVFELSDNGGVKIGRKGSDKFYYTNSDKLVTLGLKGDRYARSNDFARNVIVHEFAHRTHYERDIFRPQWSSASREYRYDYSKETLPHHRAFNRSEDIVNERIRDKNLTKTDFDPKTLFAKYKGTIPGKTEDDINELVCAYTDTIEAITAGKFGYGHGKKYFTEYGGYKRQMEWFVHASENYFLGNPVFKAEFPELYEQMDEYFSTEVGKKFLKNDLK